MDLVDRDTEVDCLVELLDGAVTGGRTVAVVGDPGIGKTRLLNELRRLAVERGVAVFAATAAEPERHLPLSLFQQALAGPLAAVDPARLAGLALPALPMREPVAGGPEVDRFDRYRAVARLLEVLAGPSGLVLLLDDLHRADTASLELCAYLVRHPPAARLVLALAYRTRPAPAGLAAALAAAGPGRARVIELAPLAPEPAATLLAGRVDPYTARRLYQLSEGNPGYLRALAGDPARYAGPGGFAVGMPAVPPPSEPVDAALAAELTALAPAPLLVTRAAAVLGDGCEPALLSEVAQLPSTTVLAALDELVQRDLLRPGPAPGQFRFRHALVRLAAYQCGGAGWRLAAHQRAAAALRGRRAPVTAVAPHVEQFAVPGDVEHVATLVAAADAAMQQSPTLAAHWLAAALRVLPGDGSATAGPPAREELLGPPAREELLGPPAREELLGLPVREELLGRLAHALGVSGQLTESRRVAHQLLDLSPGGTSRRVYAACFCATVERLLGRFAEADALLLAELNRMAEARSPAAVVIRIGLAWGDLLGGGIRADRGWADEALRAAGGCPDPALRAGALAARGLATLVAPPAEGDRGRRPEWGLRRPSPPIEHRSGLIEAAAADLRAAARVLDGLSDGQLAEQAPAMLALGWGELFLDRYADARRHLLRATEVARSTGQAHLTAPLNLALGTVYGRTGELVRAARCFDDALDAALLIGSEALRRMALSSRCWSLAWQGEVDAAIAAGEEAVAVADTARDHCSAVARFRLAEARFHGGDLDGCATDLLAAGGPSLAGLDPLSQLRACGMLAAIEAARSRPDRARTWIGLARRVADLVGAPSSAALADLAAADVLRATDPQGALLLTDAAADTFGRVGARLDLGRAHLLAGKILAATGDQAASRARFALAREVFAMCGADGLTRVAVREERSANARRPRRRNVVAAPVEPPTSCLTDRERHIADLAAVGLTNREIATRLYLSPRTVESHLARVFAKLDVRTRSALGHALRPHQPA